MARIILHRSTKNIRVGACIIGFLNLVAICKSYTMTFCCLFQIYIEIVQKEDLSLVCGY